MTLFSLHREKPTRRLSQAERSGAIPTVNTLPAVEHGTSFYKRISAVISQEGHIQRIFNFTPDYFRGH